MFLDNYICFLFATIGLEISVVALVFARLNVAELTNLLTGFLGVNLVSHPIAWFMIHFWPDGFLWIEFFVLAIEAIILYQILNISIITATVLSLFANVVSAGAGWLFFNLIQIS